MLSRSKLGELGTNTKANMIHITLGSKPCFAASVITLLVTFLGKKLIKKWIRMLASP